MSRTYTLITDQYPVQPRSVAFLERIAARGLAIQVIAWKRTDLPACSYPFPIVERIYSSEIGYASKYQKLRHLSEFLRFAARHLKDEDRRGNLVHAVDFSCALTLRRVVHATTVYELYDLTTLALRPRWLLWPFWLLDKRMLQRADHVLLASRFFSEKVKRRALVLENIPRLKPSSVERTTERSVVFYGDYRYPALIKRMMQAASRSGIERVFLAGRNIPDPASFGGFEVEVEVLGPYEYEDLSSIIERSRYIWGCYPSRSAEVVYAISNKFFESLLFGVPALYARDTRLGSLVEKEGIGVSVDPYSVSSVAEGFRRIERDYEEIRKRMARYRSRMTLDYDALVAPVMDRILGSPEKKG